MIADEKRSLPASPADPGRGTLLRTSQIAGRKLLAWLGKTTADPAWDDFLRSTDSGQFQQSSLWAQARQFDGWQCRRLVLEEEERVTGGFQMLWRRTRFGRVAYVIKGPVLFEEQPETAALLADHLCSLVRSEKFVAIVVQPPDFGRLFPEVLASRGFVPDKLMNVISATCVVDLLPDQGSWEDHLGRSKKLEIRQAVRRGAVVREGTLDDIPQFFELMAATCVRQGARPNPSSPQALSHLVRVFHEAGAARISFTEVEGQKVACVLDLKFGRRTTAWKKGWNGAHPDKRPNTLLAYESFRWAEKNGCRYFDFAGMGRSLAEDVLAERALTDEQKKDRDFFNLEFGARPQLLPPALIYWQRPLWRFLYRKAVGWPWAAARLRRAAKRLGSS